MNVTFETKCWEKDYKLMLETPHLKNMIQNCNCNFMERHVVVNNVDNKSKVREDCQKLVENGIIDTYYFADEYADEVLKEYDISKDSFAGGYYYSIAELVGIFCCKTKYLLHFSSDSYIPAEFSSMHSSNCSICLALPIISAFCILKL